MKRDGAVRVGCSGWQYRHWRGTFYPAGTPQDRWFAYYATKFDTVEINNSFYRLPASETFTRWAEQAPPGFVYAVKASRFLTHMKKLKDPQDPLARFFDNARHLDSHLGPVLYQLPPRWPLNLERLEIFLQSLDALRSQLGGRSRHVLEFREPSWYDPKVYRLLDRHHTALCLHDMEGSSSGKVVVGPFVYVRFHFGDRQYGGAYDERRLEQWSDWLTRRAESGLDVYAYFNNDQGGHAPRDAARLRERIARQLAA